MADEVVQIGFPDGSHVSGAPGGTLDERCLICCVEVLAIPVGRG